MCRMSWVKRPCALKTNAINWRFKTSNRSTTKELRLNYKRGSNCVFEPLLSKGIINRWEIKKKNRTQRYVFLFTGAVGLEPTARGFGDSVLYMIINVFKMIIVVLN